MMAAGPAGMREGDVLAGKYRIERILGAGGMGVVIAARHLELDERVALKFLLPEVLEQPDALARFAREARSAVKIRSEHVARVMDVGRLENGSPYTVMEFLEGSDLSAWLKARGVLEVEQAVEFVLQACEALAEAHVLGIVHRDLKPSNLFVTRRRDGSLAVKVLDFGISKLTGALGSGQSVQTTGLIGSPLYMSPEQMQSSRDVDARSDIWALGVIVYELLTGKPPFVADSMPELVLRVVQGGPPQPLCELRPELPLGLTAVVEKCLARDRAQRFQNVAELAVALGPFGSERVKTSVERSVGVLASAGVGVPASPVPSASSPDDAVLAVAQVTADSWANTGRPSARRRRLAWSALVAASAIGFVAWRFTRTGAARPLGTERATLGVAEGRASAPLPASAASVSLAGSLAPTSSSVVAEPNLAPALPAATSSALRQVSPSRVALDASATTKHSVRAVSSSRPRPAAEPASIFSDRK